MNVKKTDQEIKGAGEGNSRSLAKKGCQSPILFNVLQPTLIIIVCTVITNNSDVMLIS
jgi:hypothetical protein